MSIVRNALTLAFSLTLAGTAFARQPPSLVEARRVDETLPSAPGYRDAYARGPGAIDSRGYAGSGYRDTVARFAAPARGGYFETQRAVCHDDARKC
jgi:hypothetical protein